MAIIILKTKSDKDTTRKKKTKKNHRPLVLMNTDAKILSKILVNQI